MDDLRCHKRPGGLLSYYYREAARKHGMQVFGHYGIPGSDSTVRKYRPQTRRADQTWKTFLQNHAKELVAIDFFTVPTATFRVLYIFLVLAHERRKARHFHITEAPFSLGL
ncbi:MAG TPA: hypothetical protein VN784_05075 [Candidatus Limnocylindrales bacterium]|nr:hypothetical protein [Candidatus Limnocylindrales bacterium]